MLNVFDPPACMEGYEGTDKRPGSDVSEVPVNENARCTADPATGVNVRGAQNAPKAGTPERATSKHGEHGDRGAEKASASSPRCSSTAGRWHR